MPIIYIDIFFKFSIKSKKMIRSLPLTALSLLLGFFFVFVGLIKVTPKVNPDIYKDMVRFDKKIKK